MAVGGRPREVAVHYLRKNVVAVTRRSWPPCTGCRHEDRGSGAGQAVLAAEKAQLLLKELPSFDAGVASRPRLGGPGDGQSVLHSREEGVPVTVGKSGAEPLVNGLGSQYVRGSDVRRRHIRAI